MLIFLENAVKISGGGGLPLTCWGGGLPHDTSHSFSSHKVGRSDHSTIKILLFKVGLHYKSICVRSRNFALVNFTF